MILVVSDIFPHISCFPFQHAFLCSVLTPENQPVKPDFLPAQKPGFTGLKTGGLPGFSGTRVAFPSAGATSQLPVILLHFECRRHITMCKKSYQNYGLVSHCKNYD